MSGESGIPVLLRTVPLLRRIAEREHLMDATVIVSVGTLTPEEAIGSPGRRDFPILVGKERVVESRISGTRGHAFTDSPGDFSGVLEDVLDLDLSTNRNRAVYVATLNAVMGHLGLAEGTVHCRDEDPETCAREIAAHLLDSYGRVDVGLIGLNPAIAQRLAETFGPDHFRICDLNPAQIGQIRFGAEVWDGNARTNELIDASDVVVFTGTTLVNDTFDRILERIGPRPYRVYGVTAAGICRMMGFERICPCGRKG